MVGRFAALYKSNLRRTVGRFAVGVGWRTQAPPSCFSTRRPYCVQCHETDWISET